MLNSKYVSVETIIAGVYRDLGLSSQVNYEDAVEWIAEVLGLIGTPYEYLDKVAYLKVQDSRAELPCDLVYIVSTNGSGEIDDECPNKLRYFPMRYSTDTFHHRYCESIQCNGGDVTYTLNDNFIFPNFETGSIKIAYKATPTDKRGLPLIPDNAKTKRAVISYLKTKLGFIEWSRGKMAQAIYKDLEQNYLFDVGAAQNYAHIPTLDQMESLKNSWLRLIPKINDHANNFKNVGNAEVRINHTASGNDAIRYNNAPIQLKY
jgi:hypothetical protein